MSRRRRQELYCHACDRNVLFVVDMELDGNHVLNCPNCGHEHCRVVKDGVITGDRWDSRNGPTHHTYFVTSSTTSGARYSSGSVAFFSATTGW